MFGQFFGQYLLNTGYLTPEQLKDVLDYERSVHVKLGVLAINAGYMNAIQVEEVHGLQLRMDKRFGEIAIDRGYLCTSQLEDLLDMQKQRHLSLSQAIVERNYLSLADLEKALEEYKKSSGLTPSQLQAMAASDYDELVRLLLDFSDSKGGSEALYKYTALFLRNIVRFLGETPVISCSMPYDQKLLKTWTATQNISGEYHLSTAVTMDNPELIEVARRFSGENLTEIDELCLDCITELLNVTNGLYNVNCSNQGIELELDIQSIDKLDSLPVAQGYYIPIKLSFGIIGLIVASK